MGATLAESGAHAATPSVASAVTIPDLEERPMSVDVGDTAPDFTLKGRGGEELSLASFAGRQNVVLVFYPLAFSGVCADQFSAIGNNAERYADEDAQVIGISVDSHYAQSAFADALGLSDRVRMASDFAPKGEVARAYGTYMEGPEISGRATFVIDKEGIIRDAIRTDVPSEIPDEEAYFRALAACPL